MTVFQTAQGGKILKKLTKELKKVSITSIYCFIFTFFNQIFLKNIQVIGGANFEDVFVNNIVSACFDYKIMFPNIFLTSIYLTHVIEQPIFRIPNIWFVYFFIDFFPNPQYLQRNLFWFFLMILRTHFEASLRFKKN